MGIPITDLYALKPRMLWQAFATDNFAFWMSCAYLFFEYVRPQAIWPIFDAYPYWGRTLILLAFLGWLLDPERQFVWTKITTGIFVFLIVIILSSFNAYWPGESWKNFMNYFNWVVVFFVLTQTVNTRQRFFILLLIFFLASFKLSQYGARTWVMMGFGFSDWGLRGPQGFFENPGELAIQMVVFAPMVLFFILGIKSCLKTWQVRFLYLIPVTAALTCLGTNTRGGQLALAVQVLLLIFATKHRFKALIMIAIIGAVGYQLLPAEQKSRFEDMGKDSTSIQRQLYWKHGWQMMKDHPWLGVGYFNFPPYYTTHHSDDLVGMVARWGKAELPHNIFIQVGTDTGFTGLAVFLFLIAAGFLSIRKIGREAAKSGDVFVENLAKGMNLALIGYIVAGQFVTVAYYPFFWIHLALVTAMCTFWRNEHSNAVNPLIINNSRHSNGKKPATAGLGLQ